MESGFNYDLSYTRFTYPNDGGDCCGEFMASLGQPISDKFGVTGEVKLDPNSATRSAALGLEYYVTDALSLTANYGVFREDSANHNEWDFGVIYGINDRADVDLRCYDSSDEAGYLGITLSIDTTLLGG